MKTAAIVMHVVRHSDQTVVAHLFTQQFGMMPFAVRRAAGSRGRGTAAALLQPLSQLSIDCQPADGARMQVLRSAELSPAYSSLPFNPDKAATAMFLSEFLWHALRNEQPSEALFEFIALSLQWFDQSESGYANFHLLFMLRLTRYLGYDPSLLPEAGQFDIDTLMRHNYRSMRLITLSGSQRSHFLARLIAFYRENIPGFPEIKSLEILKEVYGH